MKKKKTFFDGVDASIDKQRYISCFARKQKKSSINEMLREKILQDFFKKSVWNTEEKVWRYHH